MKARLPKMKTDRAVERVLAGDLSPYMRPEMFHAASFEFAPKDATITLRLSRPLLAALKQEAARRGTKYQRLAREALEHYLQG